MERVRSLVGNEGKNVMDKQRKIELLNSYFNSALIELL